MSRPLNDQPELTFEELLADPMIRLVMRVDGVEEDELRESCSVWLSRNESAEITREALKGPS